jgi:hypothetical protein
MEMVEPRGSMFFMWRIPTWTWNRRRNKLKENQTFLKTLSAVTEEVKSSIVVINVRVDRAVSRLKKVNPFRNASPLQITAD